MTEEEAARIEAACIRLQQRYGTLADRQDPKFRELFVDDASITLPDLPTFAGMEAIMAGQAQWRESGIVMRHVCTNFTIEVIDDSHAEGITYLTVYHRAAMAEPPAEPPPSLPVSVGEFHDTFVKSGGKWLFKTRVLHRIFRGIVQP
ncbi:MAG TPA: nuclear transport factor 2 family protein [Caulobacteraceae bacterium]|jgi:hypothetical protein|nr:nuclear transport factor 2 family protein [Caulobacteraceae bacterium]